MTEKMQRRNGMIYFIAAAICFVIAAVLCIGVIGLPIADVPKEVSGQEADISQEEGICKTVVHRADTDGAYPGAELTENDKLVSSNERVALYYDEKAMTVKVEDLGNGYVWSSAMDLGMDSLSNTWQEFSRALLVIETIDSSNIKAKQHQPDFPENGYTTRYHDTGFEVDITFAKVDLQITVIFSLNEDGLVVEVPDEKIQSNPEQKHKLGRMYIMPFWGAAYKDTYPGYMFIPDGSGALIRYEKPGVYSNGYQEYIYGKDYSINASVLESATELNDEYLGEKETYSVGMPVFGVAHGIDQNAFLARINQGAEFCQLYANPAGKTIDFYWIAPQFVFREIYWVSDQAGLGFNVMQKEPNIVNAKITYSFLHDENANYTGMAIRYKEQLIDEGVLADTTIDSSAQIPLYIDALMSEPVESLFGYKTQVMTQVRDVEAWVAYLNQNDIWNLTVALRGVEPKGYSARSVRSFQVKREIGSEAQLNELKRILEASGGVLTVSKDYTRIHDVQAKTNDQIYSIERRYTVKALNAPLFQWEYYLNLPVAASLVAQWEDQPEYYSNVSLDSMGKILHSNYKTNAEYSRSEAIAQVRQVLADAAEKTQKLALQMPNEYAYQYADALYDIPVNHSEYIYETDCVPFIQTVMSGKKLLFSETMNENIFDRDVTLRLIEFNTYPSYTLTEESANLLVDSNSRDIFGSKSELMLPLLVEQYQQINSILSHTAGLGIVSRKVPANGVAVVEYENDVTVVVNYTNAAVVWHGQTVKERNATVLIGGKAVDTYEK